MFLFQQKMYEVYDIATNSNNLQKFAEIYHQEKPEIIVYDTETTGLNIMHDTPFLMAFGFNKSVFVLKPEKETLDFVYDLIKDSKILIAHNAKYDYHMMINSGFPIPDYIKLGDSLTIARLTEYADVDDRIGLETLGMKYVDPNAKFAGKVIKQKMNEIQRARLKVIKADIKQRFDLKAVTPVWEAYNKRVQFVENEEYREIFKYIDENYKKATYEDVYIENSNLMVNYLVDDIVILLEYLKVSIPVLDKVDPGYRVFKQENELIRVVGQMERVGIKADIDYLLKSREKVQNYRDIRREKMQSLIGYPLSVGQHQKIKDVFYQKWNIMLEKTDISALKEVQSSYDRDPSEFASLIIELRTIEKWLSTYIEGMLNRIINGRIHTNVNNAGAVTGRVSSDLQQQPKKPLLDTDGNELFHPRRVFTVDEGSKIAYFDYSQMELRLQAHYTILVSGGDVNLCRAFMPFQCKNIHTGEIFDYKKHNWDNHEWVTEDGTPWEPVDLHAVTTMKAFPHITPDDPDFSKYRALGKVANFLKNYAGGIGAIIAQLGVDENTAQALNSGYYQAFPKILEYQKWVEATLSKQGYVPNIFGRRYYIRDASKYYKAYNYLIQGGCADLLKNKEIKLYNYIERNQLKSRMLLPVHDEIQVEIVEGEEWIIPQIKAIMDSNDEYMGTLPMLCDIEISETNWAEKRDYDPGR